MIWPMFGMAALTAIAWVIMGRRRQAAVRSHAIIPMTPEVSVSTRHFANHFEIPTLFHVVCLAHIALAAASWAAVALAWGFVVLRGLHMREHLGRNRVMTRFNLYASATLLMWLLWLHLAGAVVLRA